MFAIIYNNLAANIYQFNLSLLQTTWAFFCIPEVITNGCCGAIRPTLWCLPFTSFTCTISNKKDFTKFIKNMKIIQKQYFWTVEQQNKTLSINEGRNIWRRSPSVSKFMKILPILYFFAVCQNHFVGVLWRISHLIKPCKTWNTKKVYGIFYQHQLIFIFLIRQIMIPHQCTDSIMRNWL